jgi:hypothetical protein
LGWVRRIDDNIVVIAIAAMVDAELPAGLADQRYNAALVEILVRPANRVMHGSNNFDALAVGHLGNFCDFTNYLGHEDIATPQVTSFNHETSPLSSLVVCSILPGP